jgi:ABC-type polysaccharide/polyol phosphate export permease
MAFVHRILLRQWNGCPIFRDANLAMSRTASEAASDVLSGARFWRLWLALALEDIGIKHRGTALGPLWIVVNYVLLSGTFILLFNKGGDPKLYASHAMIGLLIWQFLADLMNSGVKLFHKNATYVSGTKLPMSFYVYNCLALCVMRSLYALIGCVLLFVFFGSSLILFIPAAIGSFLIILLIAPAAIIILAFTGAFYSDTQFLVTNFTRIAMFLTPVFWMHEGAHGVRGLLYYWNPFTHFIEIVRVPLMYGVYPWDSLLICIGVGLIAWFLAAIIFVRLRRQVVFVI